MNCLHASGITTLAEHALQRSLWAMKLLIVPPTHDTYPFFAPKTIPELAWSYLENLETIVAIIREL